MAKVVVDSIMATTLRPKARGDGKAKGLSDIVGESNGKEEAAGCISIDRIPPVCEVGLRGENVGAQGEIVVVYRNQRTLKACVCGHGIGIHHRIPNEKRAVCNHPGCDCKEYSPAAPKQGDDHPTKESRSRE
jgi:hypothetical protein